MRCAMLFVAGCAARPSCRWTLRVSIGRATGLATSMPEEWGRSGSTLPFALTVDVLTARSRSEDERVGEGAFAIEPCTNEVSITGFAGAMGMPVQGGGWTLDDANGRLKFWLSFPEGSSCEEDRDVCNVWDLAPDVSPRGSDVNIPPGRLYFETNVVDDRELERLNRRFLAARTDMWKAKERVASLERTKKPAPVWSAEKELWVVEGKSPSLLQEFRLAAALTSTEKVLDKADKARPQCASLSRAAGQWPSGSPTRWLCKKGTVWIKRVGPFGELPFGVGSHYTRLGTWSAEPVEPVETFWTMPD